MTRELARTLKLDLFCFPPGTGAMEFAFGPGCEERRVVAVFEEELSHFPVHFVACRPTPAIKKFHERIVEGFPLDHLPEGSH